MLVFRTGSHKTGKTLIRLLFQRQPDLGLHCLPMPFYQTSIRNFKTFTVNLIIQRRIKLYSSLLNQSISNQCRSWSAEEASWSGSTLFSILPVIPWLKVNLATKLAANKECINNRTFLLSVKAVTLISICGRGSAISSAKQGKSGSIYNLVKN